jgi:cysteine synthase B
MKMKLAKTSIEQRINELEPYVGNTPLFRIDKLFQKPGVNIYAKLEWQQFGGSVKARPAFNIIRQAIRNGDLDANKTLLDATSGNTGIAYAIFAAVAGIKLHLCVPENASKERKHIFHSLGARITYTSALETTDGSQRVAKELLAASPDEYFYADQYANDNNWLAHYQTTAPEIWDQTFGKVTHFVAGLGTTGTFTGTGTRLKELNPDIQLTALQPETALHGLEGWKHLETAHVPKIYNDQLADEVLEVDTQSSYDILRDAAKYEGLLLSPSSAACLLGAIGVAQKIDKGTIVVILPDDASKYSEVIQQIMNN